LAAWRETYAECDPIFLATTERLDRAASEMRRPLTNAELIQIAEETGEGQAAHKLETAAQAVDAIGNRIMAMPAKGVAGLAIKMHALAWDCLDARELHQLDWAEQDMDWGVQRFVTLTREMEQMAGGVA
jgi:hypothetical protein